jgi:hypothetical protein
MLPRTCAINDAVVVTCNSNGHPLVDVGRYDRDLWFYEPGVTGTIVRIHVLPGVCIRSSTLIDVLLENPLTGECGVFALLAARLTLREVGEKPLEAPNVCRAATEL